MPIVFLVVAHTRRDEAAFGVNGQLHQPRDFGAGQKRVDVHDRMTHQIAVSLRRAGRRGSGHGSRRHRRRDIGVARRIAVDEYGRIGDHAHELVRGERERCSSALHRDLKHRWVRGTRAAVDARHRRKKLRKHRMLGRHDERGRLATREQEFDLDLARAWLLDGEFHRQVS